MRSYLAYRKARRLALVPADTSPTPTVTSSSPAIASITAGATVVITGSGFMATAPRPDAGQSFTETVYFGADAAASFVVDSATQITAVAPDTVVASPTIVVNTSGGCGVLTAAAVVTYRRLTEAGDYRTTEATDLRVIEY